MPEKKLRKVYKFLFVIIKLLFLAFYYYLSFVMKLSICYHIQNMINLIRKQIIFW